MAKTPKLKPVTVADLESLVRALKPLVEQTVHDAVVDAMSKQPRPVTRAEVEEALQSIAPFVREAIGKALSVQA